MARGFCGEKHSRRQLAVLQIRHGRLRQSRHRRCLIGNPANDAKAKFSETVCQCGTLATACRQKETAAGRRKSVSDQGCKDGRIPVRIDHVPESGGRGARSGGGPDGKYRKLVARPRTGGNRIATGDDRGRYSTRKPPARAGADYCQNRGDHRYETHRGDSFGCPGGIRFRSCNQYSLHPACFR